MGDVSSFSKAMRAKSIDRNKMRVVMISSRFRMSVRKGCTMKIVVAYAARIRLISNVFSFTSSL